MTIDAFGFDFQRSQQPFCTYWYRDPRPETYGDAIYIGEGSTKTVRPLDHWRNGSSNTGFDEALNNIRAWSLRPIVEIVEFFDTKIDAQALEIKLISFYGRRDLGTGTLYNRNAGGQGWNGVNPEALKKAAKLRWDRPEEHTKASDARKGIRAVNPKKDRWITSNGQTMQLVDWAYKLGCHPAAILQRVNEFNWSWEDAVTKPIPGRGGYEKKLNSEKAAEIISLYIGGGETEPSLAKRFDVTPRAIHDILVGKNFKDVPRDVEAIRRVAERGKVHRYGTGLMLTHDGQTHSIKEWSSLVGIHENVIRERKRRGLSDADALAHVNASGEHNRRISPSEYPEIARLHAAGEGATLIARRYGVAKSTITVALRKMRAMPEAAE